MTAAVTYGILPYLSYFDRDKLPNVNGKLYFYDQNTRLPKTVYLDPAGNNAAPNPLDLDSAGRLPALYYLTDSPYYIVMRDSSVPSNILWSLPNFSPPAGGGVTPTTVDEDFDNLAINGQFRFQSQNEFSPAPTTATQIAPDAYYFKKNGNGATDRIDFVKFDADVETPDATPIYYLKYTCSVAGSNETYKDVYYEIQDVRSLAGQQVTFFISGATIDVGSTKSIALLYEQNFGTGGTPSNPVINQVTTFSLTNTWTEFTSTFTLPALIGKDIGTNGDDKLIITIRMPTNQTSEIGITNWYIKRGEASDQYPYETYAQTNAKLRALQFPSGSNSTNGFAATWKTETYNGTGSYQLIAQPPIGSIMMWPTATAPYGWVIQNGSAYPNVGLYSNLYSVIGYTETCISGFALTSQSTNEIVLTCDRIGVATAPSKSTGNPFTLTVTTAGSTTVRQVVTLTCTAASTLTNGMYFVVHTPQLSYLVWLEKDGEYATQPYVANANPVKVKITTGMTDTQVRDAVYNTLNQLLPNGVLSFDNFVASASSSNVTVDSVKIGAAKSSPDNGNTALTVTETIPGSSTAYQRITIGCVAASALEAGQYFDISTPNYNFRFWLVIDGVGQQPAAGSSDYLIPIILTGSESSTQVATALATALTYPLFQVANPGAMVYRGVSSGTSYSSWTYDGNQRYKGPNTASDTSVGSLQYDNVISHRHEGQDGALVSEHSGSGGGALASGSGYSQDTTNAVGALDNVMRNKSTYYIQRAY
jgi:hypothetical protein